jgi:hypothetical protein
VRYAAHTSLECRSGIFIPGIAVSAAHANAMCTERFDRCKRFRQFGRDRYTFQNLRVFEQLPHSSR